MIFCTFKLPDDSNMLYCYEHYNYPFTKRSNIDEANFLNSCNFLNAAYGPGIHFDDFWDEVVNFKQGQWFFQKSTTALQLHLTSAEQFTYLSLIMPGVVLQE